MLPENPLRDAENLLMMLCEIRLQFSVRITGPVKNHISEHHLFIYVSSHGLESATCSAV